MKPLGVSAALLLGVLLALTVGVQTRAYADKDDSTFSNKSLKGNFTFHLRPATSFAPFYDGDVNAGPTVGRNSGVYGAPRQDILRVGVVTANGNGGLTGRTIATTDDGATTLIIDFTFSGTYTVNADG